MSADSTTETGLGIILRPGHTRVLPRTPRSEKDRRAGRAGAGDRMARRLENLALVLAVLAIGLGLFMLTYWVTQAIVNGTGNPFPNVQHASTYPHPATR